MRRGPDVAVEVLAEPLDDQRQPALRLQPVAVGAQRAVQGGDPLAQDAVAAALADLGLPRS